MFHELTATIDRECLRHNLELLRGRCRTDTRICVAVKADAYGHGAALLAPELQRLGVDMAAVATLEEAIELRRVGWQRSILVLGAVLTVLHDGERRDRVAAIVEHGLTPTITDAAPLALLSAVAAAMNKTVAVHIKFDSGMGRQGVMPDEVPNLVEAALAYPAVRLSGLYSHFATADLEQHDLAGRQLATFRTVLERVSERLPPGSLRHLANTAATLDWSDAQFDMVRPGLGVYGYAPSPDIRRRFDLKPILRVASRITLLKTLPPGHCVGYGQTFTTRRHTRVGVVPVGYSDGFLRGLSNNAVLGTPGGDAPVIGRVSMDQLTIDLSELPGVGVGDEVVLIDSEPSRPNSIESIASRLGTIPYEVICMLGGRMNRRWHS